MDTIERIMVIGVEVDCASLNFKLMDLLIFSGLRTIYKLRIYDIQ